jgi:hypothetical protein
MQFLHDGVIQKTPEGGDVAGSLFAIPLLPVHVRMYNSCPSKPPYQLGPAESLVRVQGAGRLAIYYGQILLETSEVPSVVVNCGPRWIWNPALPSRVLFVDVMHQILYCSLRSLLFDAFDGLESRQALSAGTEAIVPIALDAWPSSPVRRHQIVECRLEVDHSLSESLHLDQLRVERDGYKYESRNGGYR